MEEQKFSLSKAYQDLSQRYRQSSYTPGFKGQEEVCAYAAARMPATKAAVLRTLTELPDSFIPKTLLDLGAGTGAASLSALEVFPSLESITLVEQDDIALAVAKDLLQPFTSTHQFSFKNTLLQNYEAAKDIDLIILSYVLNELPLLQQHSILRHLIHAHPSYVLILMPGTPACFQQMLTLRQIALEAGYFLLAPCPHALACPMTQSDWCHFKVRLPRSPAHRLTKEAALAFEDEKFCYLLLSKIQPEEAQGRIVKNPLHRSGHSLFDVCEKGVLNRYIIGRKQKTVYKEATRLRWGDQFPFNLLNKQ